MRRGERHVWTEAIDDLLVAGDLKAAERGARHVHRVAPKLVYYRTVCDVFDRLPRAPWGRDLRADPARTCRVFPRKGARQVAFLFAVGPDRVGMPWPLAARWFARLPAHLVLLRDSRQLYFLAGVEGIGDDRAETVAGLGRIAGELGAERILCCGSSVGVFAALRYGLELGAERVLGLSGPTNLDREFALVRRPVSRDRVLRRMPAEELDLRPAYAAASRSPEARIVYGSDNWNDRLQGENMAGLPTVTLEMLDGVAEHNVMPELVRRNRMAGLIDWLGG